MLYEIQYLKYNNEIQCYIVFILKCYHFRFMESKVFNIKRYSEFYAIVYRNLRLCMLLIIVPKFSGTWVPKI